MARAVRRGGVTHASFVAAHARARARGRRPARSALPARADGRRPGAARPRRAGARRGLPALQTYGLTEACSQVTTERPEEADGTTRAAPLPGLRAAHRRTPTGAARRWARRATIEVRGPTLMAGYLDQPAATPRPSATAGCARGDLGAPGRRAAGSPCSSRRTDLHRLRRGERLPGGDRGGARRSPGGARRRPWSGVPDARWGQVPVAVVVRPPGGRRSTTSRPAARGSPASRSAAAFLLATAIPRTAAGKRDRAAVQAASRSPADLVPSEDGGPGKHGGPDGVQVVMNRANQMETTPRQHGSWRRPRPASRRARARLRRRGPVGHADQRRPPPLPRRRRQARPADAGAPLRRRGRRARGAAGRTWRWPRS